MAAIELEGLPEFNKMVRKAADRDLPKRIGQANKAIGQLVISKLPQAGPQAVGTGAGATVRPSATKREVLLRVGGAHRVNRASTRSTTLRVQQWGKTQVRPFQSGERPHIIGMVEKNRSEIEQAYFKAIEKAMAGDGPFVR